MTFLTTPDSPPSSAARAPVPNYARLFAIAPDVQAGWQQLASAVVAGMDHRRYELVTLVAARRLGSAYCTLAHASVLRESYLDEKTLLAVAVDRAGSGLDPVELAVMDFAEEVAGDPASITEADVERLRECGLSDTDIFHVVAAVAARRFFTTVLAATGTGPGDAYRDLGPDLRAALLSGR